MAASMISPGSLGEDYVARLGSRLQLVKDDEYEDFNGITRRVYDAIVKNVLPHAPQDTCPALPFLAHAIRSILLPSLLLSDIPNLLRLLAHLEVLRGIAIATIQHALCTDSTLSSETRDALGNLVRPSRPPAQRRVYREVVNGACLLHVHHIWRSSDPEADEFLLADVLVRYFPHFLMERDPSYADHCRASLRAHPWHYEMTETEAAENNKVGEMATRFLLQATKHLEDADVYCVNNGFPVGTPFEELLPPPPVAPLVAAIKRYVKIVTDAVDGVAKYSLPPAR